MRTLHVSLVLLCASGCALTKTSMRSQVDPAAAAKGFRMVMVVGNFADLGLRQDAEQKFVQTLAARGLTGTPSGTLFFPGRQYSAEDIKRALTTTGVDAVLILSPTGAGSSSVWIPQTTTSTTTVNRGATVYQGGRVTGGEVTGATTTTTSHGGYAVERPTAQFQATLYDAATGQSVWVASFSSGGNAFAGHDDLVRSVAKKAAGALVAQHLLR